MSKKNNSNLVIDNLRLDLGYMEPQHHNLRWDIAKQEISEMTEVSGPSRVDVGYICLLLGAGIGVYAVKWFPKTKTVKMVKYVNEALKAQRRLNKIAIEEYERLDEAMETEEQFLNMMSQDLPIELSLKLVDEEGQRRVQLEFHNRKKDKKEDE
jgi:hypothetical protein